MHIIQSTQPASVQDQDKTKALTRIRELAERVSCDHEDMEYMPGRSDFLLLCAVPEPARALDDLFHDSSAMRKEMCEWADERGFTIELDKELGPRIFWLQGGGLSSKEDRAFIFIFLRRPGHRDTTHHGGETALPAEEPPAKGIVERPIAKGLTALSSFQCRVGDVLLLEGGETLRTCKPGEVEYRDICMLTTMHHIRRKGHTDGA